MTQMWWQSFLDGVGGGFGDHLWQSTLCVLIAALFVRLAGGDRPSLRHGIWLAASVKFLVPFSLLVSVGERLAPVVAPWPATSFAAARLQTIGEPFAVWAAADSTALPLATGSSGIPWAGTLVAIWLIGSCAVLSTRWRRWRRAHAEAATAAIGTGREVHALGRVLDRWKLRRRVPIRETTGPFAPGLFGLWRPVLLWPAGLSARLTDEGIEAIVAHEVAHLRRADNLAALVHTMVEAVFWFHPAVWWLGGRLVAERERACDQEALNTGIPPGTYAESLLDVCRFSLTSPSPLVASVAGSSLSQRVESIMTYRARPSLGRVGRSLVATLALVVLIVPVAVGAGRAQNTLVMAQAAASPGSSGSQFAQALRGGGLFALRRIHPTYTAAALKAGIEGTVELEIVVLPDGTVGDARILKSLDHVYGAEFGLDAQALAAARQWRFRNPPEADGRLVARVATLILDFRLSREGASSPDRPTAQAPAVTAPQVLPSVQVPPRDPKPANTIEEFRRDALPASTPGLTQPVVVRRIDVTYTTDALRAKIQGSIELEIVVGRDGRVDRARIVKSLEPSLDAQAVQAALQWTFEPATLNEQPVAALVQLVLNFRIY